MDSKIEHADGKKIYYLKNLRMGSEVNFNEKQLLSGFFKYFDRLRPRLVSYNGRCFDLPVLKYRAMVHGINSPWLHQAGDKWNSFPIAEHLQGLNWTRFVWFLAYLENSVSMAQKYLKWSIKEKFKRSVIIVKLMC